MDERYSSGLGDTVRRSRLGDGASFDVVYAAAYDELRRIARGQRYRGPAVTLTTTALVHEVYAKLIGSEQLGLQGRQHFYSLCARTMRQIVIDHARGRCAGKRGGGQPHAVLTDDGAIDVSHPETLVALDVALERLAQRDPRLVELLQYRVFAGLEMIEIAPLAFMRGRTLSRAFIILDEAQNTSPEQMKMFLTRIGIGSRAVITGDLTQVDLPRGQRSGLGEALQVLADVRGVAFTRFLKEDVVRHPLVARIVAAYESHSATPAPTT